jgi:GNAT superfamily N-acetyltransferase
LTGRYSAGVPVERRIHSRHDVGELIDALAAWEAPGSYVTGLHAGDIGWHLRLPDEEVAASMHGWWRGRRLVAAALIEPMLARPRVAPDCLLDAEVCEAVADAVDDAGAGDLWADAQPGSLLRSELVSRGWSLDPDPWVALHVDLRRRNVPAVAAVGPTGTAVDDRVAVQRNGFEASTFTSGAWDRMAAGPGFDAGLDLIARDDEGVPVAIATAWSAGTGRCGILEPVATHADHRGRGHGRRVVQAALHALAARGASGAAVATPAGNAGAVALYTSTGMRPVEMMQALMRSRS